MPTVISGTELFPYLDSRNIDFVGYSREQYERTKALPEGSYRISFTAYDYRREDVQVSNEGSSFYYLSKNEPPLINLPVCGAKVPVRHPQQVIFSWLPRNTSSPASAGETQYEFSLYEIRPEGRNLPVQLLKENDVVKKAVEAGFEFNTTKNGLAIEKFVKKTGAGRHGPHPNYTNQLRDHLDWWARQPGNANFTPDDAKTYLDALTNNLKTKINTSSSKINDLALGLPK